MKVIMSIRTPLRHTTMFVFPPRNAAANTLIIQAFSYLHGLATKLVSRCRETLAMWLHLVRHQVPTITPAPRKFSFIVYASKRGNLLLDFFLSPLNAVSVSSYGSWCNQPIPNAYNLGLPPQKKDMRHVCQTRTAVGQALNDSRRSLYKTGRNVLPTRGRGDGGGEDLGRLICVLLFSRHIVQSSLPRGGIWVMCCKSCTRNGLRCLCSPRCASMQNCKCWPKVLPRHALSVVKSIQRPAPPSFST